LTVDNRTQAVCTKCEHRFELSALGAAEAESA
jgi:hypothetical protein